MNNIVDNGINNSVVVGEGVELNGSISGKNNKISIGRSAKTSKLAIEINGNDNVILVENHRAIRGLIVKVGNHIPANNTRLNIKKDFSIEKECMFYLYNTDNILSIGRNCMFSNRIIIRCGESPHLIFDNKTGDYLDQSTGVIIGDQVWVGEGAYLNKSSKIGDGCIVGARSVVTKEFDSTHCVIAGNPAKIVKTDIRWFRNPGSLPAGSKFSVEYDRFISNGNDAS